MDVRYTVLTDGTMSNTDWLIRNLDLATQWAVKIADAYHKVKGDRTQMVFLGDQTVASLLQIVARGYTNPEPAHPEPARLEPQTPIRTKQQAPQRFTPRTPAIKAEANLYQWIRNQSPRSPMPTIVYRTRVFTELRKMTLREAEYLCKVANEAGDGLMHGTGVRVGLWSENDPVQLQSLTDWVD